VTDCLWRNAGCFVKPAARSSSDHPAMTGALSFDTAPRFLNFAGFVCDGTMTVE